MANSTMTNSTTTAAAAAKAKAKAQVALARAMAEKQNINAVKFFAVGVGGLMVLLITLHWTRWLVKHYESKKGQRRVFILSGPVAFSRLSRSILLRKIPGFPSVGHALVIFIYALTSILITFTNINWSQMDNLAKRFGWLAIANLALIIFLALKNTPLAFLSTYSYERLNILHQVAGYGTVLSAVLHGVVYIIPMIQAHDFSTLVEINQVYAIVAALAMIIIAITALFLRRRQYEVFYVIHIVMFMLTLITVGLHVPDLSRKVVIVVIICASLWVTDRALRLFKIAYYSVGNTATLTPLAFGGTRVTLRKSSSLAVAGSHAFLWIPGVRSMETHPFTLASTNPLEFVIASQNGFTRDLHELALKKPGYVLTAGIDGPYGHVPNYSVFTKLVLIAGGSGASYTFGVAVEMIRKLGDSKNLAIEFIWTVREQECISWYAEELQELQCSPLVNLQIHYTRAATQSLYAPSIASRPLSSASSFSDLGKNQYPPRHDIEKGSVYNVYASPYSNMSIKSGRPDVESAITDIVQKAHRDDRIAVVGCGPDGLMQTMRRTVANCIKVNGPSVELHCEAFGW